MALHKKVSRIRVKALSSDGQTDAGGVHVHFSILKGKTLLDAINFAFEYMSSTFPREMIFFDEGDKQILSIKRSGDEVQIFLPDTE